MSWTPNGHAHLVTIRPRGKNEMFLVNQNLKKDQATPHPGDLYFCYSTVAYICLPWFPSISVFYAVRIPTACPRCKVGPSRVQKSKIRVSQGNLCNSVKSCPILTQQKQNNSGFQVFFSPLTRNTTLFFCGLIHSADRNLGLITTTNVNHLSYKRHTVPR